MPTSFSLSHRSLGSNVSSLHSLNDSLRSSHTPSEMAMAPMQWTNRSCQHSPAEDLPCARRILKTVKQDGAVTHTWVSCRGQRYVSTTMPLLHGVSEAQMARDAALLGHTREEDRHLRDTFARPVTPRTDSGTPSGGSDSPPRAGRSLSPRSRG